MRRVALVGLVVVAACRAHAPAPRHLPPEQAARVLIDRNWLDLWPSRADQRLHVYRFTPAMGGGVFQDRTLFAGQFELFTFAIDDDHLTIRWPHREREDRIHFHIDRVSGPEPFDLRLELDGVSQGPTVYYGRSAEGGDHALAHVLALP